MGNSVCSNICAKKKNENDVILPNGKNSQINLGPDEILKIITLQKFIKNMKFRMEVKQKISEIKSDKKKSIKESFCNFKESWDIYFKNKNNTLEFSINGLQKIKKEIYEFYTKFTKISFAINGPKENIHLTEKKIQGIKNKEVFEKEFKIGILKYMSELFSLGELNSDLEKYYIEFEKIRFMSHKTIEERNTLEDEENFDSEEVNKSVKNENDPILIEDDKSEDLFIQKKCRTLLSSTNNNVNINIVNSTILNNPNNSNNDIWFKKDTFSSNKTNWVTHTTKDYTSQSPDYKRKECRRGTISVNSESLSPSPIRLRVFKEKEKIALFHADDYNRSRSNNLETKNNQNSNSKLEMERIIEHISMEKEKDCKYISFMDKNSVFYQGSWSQRKLCKCGLGYAYMIDSTKGIRFKYYGYFYNDLYHGIGLLLYEDGYSYYGEFRNGFRCGYGIETTNETTYRGFFKNGKYHGYGEYKFENKISYVGTFLNGVRDGYGLLTLLDGAIYCGTFKQNKMDGTGSFQWPTGHKYYGAWREDKMNGLGIYRWAKGDRYVGYYENDFRHGQGEYHFKNDAVLIGIWRKSKKEGKFILQETGNVHKLNYRNDLQID